MDNTRVTVCKIQRYNSGFSLGHLHMGDLYEGDKALMGGLMRGDINLIGGPYCYC